MTHSHDIHHLYWETKTSKGYKEQVHIDSYRSLEELKRNKAILEAVNHGDTFVVRTVNVPHTKEVWNR